MRSRTNTSLTCALLGAAHPHAHALLATLDAIPDVGRVRWWDDSRAKARRVSTSAKVDFVSADLAAVLAAGCDFAVVCVRPDQLVAVAERALASGCHVLLEKPVGLTAADTWRVKRAAERANRKAAVLYIRRSHPVAQAARAAVVSGKLGPLLSLEARFLATQVRFRDSQSWLFRRKRAGGGILQWLGCHYVDLLQHVSGDAITAVSAMTARRSGERIDVEDTAVLALEFASGAIGTLHVGYALAFSGGGYLNRMGNDGYLACNGREGRLVWPAMNHPVLHLELPGRRPVREKTFRLRPSNGYSGESGERFVRQFIAALRGEAEFPATLDDAVRTARVIEAAYRSARTGRRVPVAKD